MKVLITGGLGNLGSWLTEFLIKSKFEVTTFSPSDRNVLREYQFERLFGHIDNEIDVANLFLHNEWDVIVHLASVNEGNLPGYCKKALLVNTLGTRNLLQGISESKNKSIHFIYFSTFHVYGLSSGLINEEEVHPLPKTDYASTHLFAEYYVKQFFYTHSIPYTIFRLTNSYGAPKEIGSSKWYLILNDLAKMAIEKKIIQLNSNGRPQRDFIWMGDVCNVVLKCMLKGPANDIFNLGGGVSITMLEIAAIIQAAYQDSFLSSIEIRKNDNDTKSYEDTLKVDINKLKKWISFTPVNHMYEEVIAIFGLLK